MKKFLLLKFIIILMTKDILTSTFNSANSYKFKFNPESSNEGLDPIDSDDMTENSHVTDKDTTTKNIDSIIAKFGSEFQQLKDLMVDYIKANGKRPMTHEFNKNSKKFIDYLNFLLANVQPGVMRNQIEDIVEKMNAMFEQIHGKFPNGSEDEEFVDFVDAFQGEINPILELIKSLQELLNSWKNDKAHDQDTQQNLLPDYIQNFMDQIYKNFKIDLTPNMLSLEEIITKVNLGINQLFNLLTVNQNLKKIQNVNLDRILSSLKLATNQNSFGKTSTTQGVLYVQQFFNILRQIAFEYFKAINLLIINNLLKSSNPAAPEYNVKYSNKIKSFVNSSKTEEIDINRPKSSVEAVVLSRKTNLESETSTTKISQNSPEIKTSVDGNEDLKSSIDVSTSPQNSLETVQVVENSTEHKIKTDAPANSTETNLTVPEETLENLRRLEEITKNLRMENITENDITKVANYKKEVIELTNQLRETKYDKKAEDIYNELLSLTKTLKIFKIAVSVVNSKNIDRNLQDIEKLIMKLYIIKKFYVNKNQFLRLRAGQLKQQLKMIVDQFNSKNPDIPSELIKINKTYSIPENFNLKFLNEASKNLTSIIYAVKTINSTNFANQLFKEVQNLIHKIYQTQQELNKIESQIKIPSNDTELAKLNEYKQRISELRTQPEPSIFKKAIELDESIEKVIKEYQRKNQ